MHVNKSKAGKQYRYYAYRCAKHRIHKRCDFTFVVFENKLEKIMLDRVEEILEEQEVKNIEITKTGSVSSKYDINELKEELERLNYAWKKGRIKNVEEYDRDYEELVAKIKKAENAEPAEAPDYSYIKETLSGGWKTIYEALDNEHKRAFWRSFVEEIHIEWNKKTKDVVDIKFF